VIAFKWLLKNAVSPFTGFRWAPRAWVDAPPTAGPGAGIHSCRIADLPWWVSEELWRVELEGPVVERATQIEAPRGRILERIERWDPRVYADACAARVAALVRGPAAEELEGYARDAQRRAESGAAGNASYIAAVAAVAAAGGDERAFAAERAWQAQWLAHELRLIAG